MDMIFRNRKFKFAAATWLMGNFWLYSGFIDGPTYMQLMFAVLTVYAAGSVGGKFAERKKS